MKDDRLYARFTLDLPDSPKFVPLSVEAKWAYVEMVVYSRRMMTDGFIANAVALAKWGASICSELASNDVEKPSLIEVENGYKIHDFEKHQTTRSEIEELRDKRKRAGQKGGRSKALASAKQVLKQNASKSNPETETETETTTTKGFDEFWDAYPKKADKGQARKAFNTALKKTPAENLVTAAKQYASSVQGKERKYIKNPSTWLNAEAWENDDAQPPPEPEPTVFDMTPEDWERWEKERFGT